MVDVAALSQLIVAIGKCQGIEEERARAVAILKKVALNDIDTDGNESWCWCCERQKPPYATHYAFCEEARNYLAEAKERGPKP